MAKCSWIQMVRVAVFAAAALGAAGSSLPAGATSVTVGVVGESRDCTFGCVEILQQVYDGANFGSAPVEITSVGFFSASDVANSGSFDLYLSTSNNPLGSLSPVFADNSGADRQFFGSLTLSGLPADMSLVNFLGSFDYDPTVGDLLVEFESTVFGRGSFWASSDQGIGRVHSRNEALSGFVTQNFGLTTQFELADPIPEPSTSVLMGLGLVALVS